MLAYKEPTCCHSIGSIWFLNLLKTGCMGFACLEYYADAILAVILSPAVATAGWRPVPGGLFARRIALAGHFSTIGIVLM